MHRNSAQDAPFNYTDNDFKNKVLNPEEIFTTVTKTADLLTGIYYIYIIIPKCACVCVCVCVCVFVHVLFENG